MAPRKCAWVLALISLAGCSSSRDVSDTEVQAQEHMAVADTLERASALTKATAEYLLVAEHFASTSVYPRAVKKAALLLGSPSNPAASDSASVYWLKKYLSLAQDPDESQLIHMYLTLVDRATVLNDSLGRLTALIDSLTAVTHKQTGEVVSRNHRLQELEAELEKVSTELRKLKEIDIRLSRSRDKNKP